MKQGRHILNRYDQELESLRSRVTAMGGLVERQISDAMKALVDGNTELAEYVIRTDHRVNAQEVGIDEDCTYILARRQPAAGDLRMVMAIIKTITDIERMGDESEKVARMAIELANVKLVEIEGVMNRLVEMSGHVQTLFHKALDAFVRLDVEAAVEAVKLDTEIDRRYGLLLTELVEMHKQFPANAEQIQNLVWVVRSLERMGDHAKNMCEYIVYLVKGKDVRHISIDEMEKEVAG